MKAHAQIHIYIAYFNIVVRFIGYHGSQETLASAGEPLILSLMSQSVKCKETVIQLTCLITHFLTNDGNQINCI